MNVARAYKLIDVSRDTLVTLEKRLNRWGKDGWRVVAGAGGANDSGRIIVLEREADRPEPQEGPFR